MVVSPAFSYVLRLRETLPRQATTSQCRTGPRCKEFSVRCPVMCLQVWNTHKNGRLLACCFGLVFSRPVQAWTSGDGNVGVQHGRQCPAVIRLVLYLRTGRGARTDSARGEQLRRQQLLPTCRATLLIHVLEPASLDLGLDQVRATCSGLTHTPRAKAAWQRRTSWVPSVLGLQRPRTQQPTWPRPEGPDLLAYTEFQGQTQWSAPDPTCLFSAEANARSRLSALAKRYYCGDGCTARMLPNARTIYFHPHSESGTELDGGVCLTYALSRALPSATTHRHPMHARHPMPSPPCQALQRTTGSQR